MLIDAVAYAFAEIVSLLISRLTGRAFNITPKQARKISEYLVLGLFAVVAIVITFVFS